MKRLIINIPGHSYHINTVCPDLPKEELIKFVQQRVLEATEYSWRVDEQEAKRAMLEEARK